ncbi:efflux RND transporter periplasmic adaptor subunit [Hephaestia sp. GCM10023244]|uniref:efflux RND transporter periplasmic adaptor subunit n=1 Tax=unclassified Hephaestia TaxID=2631281 RepID=UPI0020777FC0|nr:efflux RND transporter periplasmic adaptor subunit [Hephaestia sp. MAHUQ-44]MCM8730251.1 efflux RND transporter periplasmic adaptor subunit [Hephaestia sp. MAHUQ-44]
MPPVATITRSFRPLLAASLLALAACGGSGKDAGRGMAGQQTPEVGYVVMQPTQAPLTTELAGRTSAYKSSEVRPQVTGLITRRYFTEGAIVRQGEPLYQIDPRLYRASANQAEANLVSARASAEAARARADRYKPLAAQQAVSEQDYADALAQARSAEAAVKQQQAALESAKVNLNFTTVPAPITGRIGRSLFTVGALVTTSQADPLATIQQLDPIYVDIQRSSSDLLALRRALADGGTIPASAAVRLVLEDGSDYGQTGTVEFSEVVVDPNTGTVTMRARFPNPQGLLLPGMFVRARFTQAINTRAFLVPEQGLTRDPKGNATVLIVGPENKVIQRIVKAERTDGANWVVTDGLNPGDKVITQGTAKAMPGQVVKPVLASTQQQIGAPPKPPQGAAPANGR